MSMRFSSRSIAAAGILGLAGCASEQPAPVVDLSLPSASAKPVVATSEATADSYRVVRGDTLYAIAFRHGVDYRDLAAWNGIAAPYRILVGQDLRLRAPVVAATAASSAPAHVEPAPGEAVTSAVVDHAATVVPAAGSAPGSGGFQPVEEMPAAAAVNSQPVPPVPAHVPAPVAEPASPVAPKPVVAEASKPAAPASPVSPPPVVPPAKPAENVAELNAGGVVWRWPCDGKVVAAYVSGDPTRQGIDLSGQAGDPVHAAADGEVVYSGNGLIGYGELIIVKHNANFLSAYGHNRKRLVKEGDKVKAGQPIAELGSGASAREELHFEIRKNGKPVNPLEYLPVR